MLRGVSPHRPRTSPGRRALLALLLTALLVATLVGCGDDEPGTDQSATAAPATATATPGEPASPATVAASPTAVAGTCPLAAAVCNQARQLASSLNAGDFAAITQAVQVRSYTCPAGRPPGPGGPFPLCDGAAAGEVRQGVGVARRYSEGAALGLGAYQDSLRGFMQAVNASASDANGAGTLRLVAIGCRDATEPPPSCTRPVVIFSAITRQAGLFGGLGVNAGRELLIFFLDATAPAGSLSIQETWTGIVQPPEADTIFRTGGALFDIGRLFVLSSP